MSYQKAEGRSWNAAAGFTLVELMIAMVAFVFVIAAASQMLTGLLTQFKQQSKISETNIEGIIGLEILRHDLEHAGYGLPWVISGTNYNEATNAALCDAGTVDPSTYNDSTTNPPRAIVSGNNNCTNSSDYLVIKAVNVAGNDPSRKSTRLISTAPYVRTWTPSSENLNLDPTDRVIVISGGAGSSLRELIESGGTFYTTYNNVINAPWQPSEPSEYRIVYGINDNSASAPRMPFNRADYYIATPIVPLERCAVGTGVLYKATLNHGSGALNTPMPILDCVADMQVVYAMDNDEDGDFENGTGGDAYTNSLAGLTAQQIRTRVKEVQVYILAHEGQRDPNFTFNNFTGAGNSVIVGRSSVFGNDFDLTTITDYENYRWKVYTISVHTENLGA